MINCIKCGGFISYDSSNLSVVCDGCKAKIGQDRGMVEDGFGCSCSAYCPKCGGKTMYVCRPGDIRCSNCD